MDRMCTHCGATVAVEDMSCDSCGQPVATTRMLEPEVLASPNYADKPQRRIDRRLVVGLGVGVFFVLLVGGLMFSIRGGSDPRDIVEEFATAYGDGDCEKAADAFHYEEAADRASEVAICNQGSDRAEFLRFEVTRVEESQSGLAIPDGASEVVRVGYTAELLVHGDREMIEDTFVVAKYDGNWMIVFQRIRAQQ